MTVSLVDLPVRQGDVAQKWGRANNLWPGTYGNSLRIIKWLIVDFKDPEL